MRAIRATAAVVAPPAGWKPVEVFTKSAPADSAVRQAMTMPSSSRTADSMITFSRVGLGTAPRAAAISSSTVFPAALPWPGPG